MVKFTRKGSGSSKRTYAAASALRKAATLIRARSSGLSGPPRTGGFYGNYKQFSRGGPHSGRELKFIDTEISAGTLTTAGTVTFLNGVAQGTDFNNRIGRKTLIKSILWNCGIYPIPSTTQPAGEFVRMIIFYDTQTNSAAVPAVTDVLAVADPFSPMNLNNRDRFHIIWDKKINLNPATYAAGALTAGAPMTKYITKYKKCNKEVVYSGTGGTIGSIQTGSICILTISYNGTLYDHTSYFRFRFFDS